MLYLCAVLERERSSLGELHEVVVQQHLPHPLSRGRHLAAVAPGLSAARQRVVQRLQLAAHHLHVARAAAALQVERARDVALWLCVWRRGWDKKKKLIKSRHKHSDTYWYNKWKFECRMVIAEMQQTIFVLRRLSSQTLKFLHPHCQCLTTKLQV